MRMHHVTRLAGLRLSASEMAMGRLMRAPDGHEGGDPPADPPANEDGDPPAPDFAFLPAEILKDGTIDAAALRTHYETLAPKAADIPATADDYTIEPLEGVDMDQMKASPLFGTLRTAAHKAGMGNAAFQTVVQEYVGQEIKRGNETYNAEVAKLGENGKARIDSVANWLGSRLDAEEVAGLQGAISTAAGVRAIEKLMGKAPAPRDEGGDNNTNEDTKETIEALQASPEYWDRRKRDPQVVARVEKFYRDQAAKKATA